MNNNFDKYMATGLSIGSILTSPLPIKDNISKIEEIWKIVDNDIPDNDRVALSNAIKSRVQQDTVRAFITMKRSKIYGAAYMATGIGKSKIAIDIIEQLVLLNSNAKCIIVVPTEKLRDNGWKEEFEKWGKEYLWYNVVIICYASLANRENYFYDMCILDEGHNITENNSEFFEKNEVTRCLLLTASKPKDNIKLQILKELGIEPFYELSLDEAVKLGIVAPYEITVITMGLDDKEKYIQAGSKDKSFMTTEKGQYSYLSSIKALRFSGPMGYIRRMQFIYNLKSKTENAKAILQNVIPKDLRTLIFCGSKDQANQLCEYRFYSKPTPPKKLPIKVTETKRLKYAADLIKYKNSILQYQEDISLNAFLNHKINRLACVEALNEGHNIPMLDVGFVVQLNSNEKDFIQRAGRLLRFRPGHIGKLIILCCADTMDREWVLKATANLNASKIEWIELSRLRMGIETINF